jgi:hypothetical protein
MKKKFLSIFSLLISLSLTARSSDFLDAENLGIDPTIITNGELIFPALGSYGTFFKYEEILPNVSNKTYDYL